jgi:outer membrane receptor protein involved in Fe transport
VRLNFNFRGRQQNSLQSGGQYGNNNIREYYRPRWNADVNVAWAFRKNMEIFLNVRNLWDEPQDLLRYSSVTPDYSQLYRREKFGAQITLGVKGSF